MFVHLDIEVGLIVGGVSFGLIFILLPLVAIAGVMIIFVAVGTSFACRRFACAGWLARGIAFVAGVRALSFWAASSFGVRGRAGGTRAVVIIRTITAFSFFTVVWSPPTFSFLAVAWGFEVCRVVANSLLGLTFQVFKLKLGITLKTSVSVEFDDIGEREVPIQEFVHARRVDRVVSFFGHGV
jgi:hypothetical protein